ncbi:MULTISPECIES: type VI secretion system protein TssA [unclassified Acinetobacter]|uniref:type VI secretion system protein TssA n=1 Tax=unclassified Acinetobacter TaxID=196816 RepID=UPI00244BAC42|nr:MULTISPECIES: type VI secretion system protein TssA [unclassified Acinetobacter]MDH0032150.1 type VI secretion system protein TssA [Acinetobacter sp. GD04021]MDH0887833.1 type VI secretion system protein TssA [Acinetobacter sp. GD03873]MDH1081891.1 type VI secretion system protein TssA [Acinetobacter sp. GD03983]MDH2191149.1 type VI secretion system protein TssA [Acinetobacter sp. GD03645]MDH2204666.1 type VI secretion system protein TssA [Acinetobacter sp. GD03647]
MHMDISSLLHPIDEQSPCGEDYSFSNEFHAIKKAKTQDDVLLDQGDWVTEPKQADWDFVAATTIDLLQSKTKDIRLLTWLSEAWANLYGFEGIGKSLELSHRLLEQYWLTVHPEVEDDDLDQRIGLLQGLINQLPLLIKKVPLINHAPFYHLLDYDNFLYHENVRRKQSDDYESGNQSAELEQFEQALSTTDKNFQYQNYQYFNDILQQWSVLKNVLDGLLGLDSPSFAAIDSSLDHIHLSLKKIYETDRFVQSTQTSDTMEIDTSISPVIQSTTIPHMPPQNQLSFQPQVQSHVENREQAMRVLQDIASYFEKNEPHSPVSYMLQKTIKWSQMPLHEWLMHVIKDEHPLQMLQDMLGVQPKNEYE